MALFADHSELLHRLRRAEIEQVFGRCPAEAFEWALELGAGDGFQSGLLKPYARHLVATDMNAVRLRAGQRPDIGWLVADAETIAHLLPAGRFDLVFSSNLLEHLPHPLDALRGTRALLRDEGICVHVVPNRLWKVSQLALYNPVRAHRWLGRLGDRGSRPARPALVPAGNNVKLGPRQWRSRWLPPPHGAYADHWSELRAFGRRRWQMLFAEAGFDLVEVCPGPVMWDYNLDTPAVCAALGRMGLASEFILIAQKRGVRSVYQRFLGRGSGAGP